MLIVGRIRRAHGVRGEVAVDVMTEAPDAIFAPGARVFLADARGIANDDSPQLRVETARGFKDGLLVVFDAFPTRNEAELARGRYLLVPASEVDPPTDDEVFIHELRGLTVLDESHAVIGVVADVVEMPNGLLLDIKRERDSVLLPYQPAFLVSLDRVARHIVVRPPEGLFE